MIGGTTTSQYVNSPVVTVSFEVLDTDWEIIQKSGSWKRIQDFIESEKEPNEKKLEGAADIGMKIDETILNICEKIRKDYFLEVRCAEMVQALASLISARNEYKSDKISCDGGERSSIL